MSHPLSSLRATALALSDAEQERDPLRIDGGDTGMSESEFEVKVSPSGSMGPNAVFCCCVFEPSVVCGHPIGSGSTVCIQHRGSCGIKSHKGGQPLNLPPGPHVGISKVSSNGKVAMAAVSKLFVAKEDLSPETMAEWRSKEHESLDDWTAMFLAARAGSGSQARFSPEKVKEDRRNLEAVTDGYDDDVMSILSAEDSFTMDDWSFTPTQLSDHLPENIEEELFARDEATTDARISALFARTSRVASAVDNSATALTQLSRAVERRHKQHLKAFGKCTGAISSLSFYMGKRSNESTFPTLWRATEILNDGLESVRADLVDLPDLAAGLSRITIAEGAMSSLRQAFGGVTTSVSKIKTETEEALSHVAGILGAIPDRFRKTESGATAIATELSTLRAEIQQLKMSTSTGTSAPPAAFLAGIGASNPMAAPPSQAAFQGQIDTLRQQLVDLALAKDESVVTVGKFSFGSAADAHAWVKKYNPDSTWDCIFDPLIVLHRIVQAGGDSLKEMEIREKLGLSNENEALTMQSLGEELPNAFHKGAMSFATATDVSPLNQLKDFKAWKDGLQGLKPHLVQQITQMSRLWRLDITTSCQGRAPELADLLNALLTETHQFLIQLFEFIDDQYDSLTSISRFGNAPSWALVTSVLKRIMLELYAPKRGNTGQLAPKRDKAHAAGLILWSSLQSLRVVKRYVADGIQFHPSVVTEYVAFLTVRCNGSDKFDDLLARQKDFDTRVKAAEKTASTAQSKADAASTKFTEISREVKKLSDKIP